MKTFVITLLFLTGTCLFAQQPFELPLWSNGASNSNGQVNEKQQSENDKVNNITVYLSSKPNGMAIIMCPGGGYGGLAINHEGHDMAAWFNTQGITYIVLKYRMPNGHPEIPLSDAEQAIRIVRQHAGEWNVNSNRIGIMGASAGGHLASTLATHYTSKETRPDFQILLYPVITMKASTHGGSRTNLLGKNPSEELETKYSNELQVTENTPQAFITLSSDDNAVPAVNSINYYMALLKYKVPVSLHAYPVGGHGWGFRDDFLYKRQWTEELEKWLRTGLKF